MLACVGVVMLCCSCLAQPASELLARSLADTTDHVERVRLWCVLLGDRFDDHSLVLADPKVRAVLADTANDATLSWVLAASAARSRGRFDSARILLDRAEHSLAPDTDERVRAAVLLDQAGILSVTGDQATATRKYYAVLPVLQRRSLDIDLGMAYIGLGFIFRYQRQFDEALTYYDRAAALAGPLGDAFMLGSALRGRAGILMERDSINAAEELYRRALALADNPRVEAVLHTELANVHVLRREYAAALPDFTAALARFEEDNNLTWSSYLCARVAETLMMLDRTEEARTYGRKGLAIAVANGLRKEELDNLGILPKVCARLGLWEEALAYSRTFEAIDDSLRNDVVSTELAQLEVQLQAQRDSLARAEREEKERLVHEAGMAQAKDERNLLLLLSSGVFLAVGGLWFRLRRVRRTRLELARGNAAIGQEKQRAERSERVKDQFLA
ncbi:MAG: tetratricopeptide repeat protein, partial [Flavobacteriales bacterium]|nr:tetratricopeptide repeat protein [Flavobacteriales bacterium]